MFYKIKKNITVENLLFIFVILSPILDIVSFLFRNYFNTSISPSTVIRPIIPCICFIILFFKEKNKKKKIGICLIYFLYSLIHLYFFQKLHNKSSYGNIKNEIQYILNYSIMILNLYNFYSIRKNIVKIQKAVIISLLINIISIYFSIISKTTSYTYLEGIGFKGYFESGNSLCTTLILSVCIILAKIEKRNYKEIMLIIFTGIYLVFFNGMRTGLYGFSIVIITYIFGKFLILIRDKAILSKKQISLITFAIIIGLIIMFVLGSKTLERRKMLKQNEEKNIDIETNEKRYVTGDILNLYKKIKNDEVLEDYMSKPEQKAIVDLLEFAKKIKLSNVNLRMQQLIYNTFLVKEQKNLFLILFGNGYKNQTGELVMEMEIPAMLMNFGVFGFILYFGPFLKIFIKGIFYSINFRKEIQIDNVMYIFGLTLAFSLSMLSGYVLFSFSSMTMVLILCSCVDKSFRKE